MAETSIEWCDVVWNVTRGCSRVSLGCGGPGRVGGCYAERQAMRFSGPGMPYGGLVRSTANGPRWTGRVELIPSKLDEPLHWRKPRRVFVNSMSDLFHEALPDEAIAAAFAVMSVCPQHTFQILTKRPERMRRWFDGIDSRAGTMNGLRSDRLYILRGAASRYLALGKWPTDVHAHGMDWPLPNVWLGVSVEDQATADERVPLLLQTPAAKRFVSYEPALGPVDLAGVRDPRTRCTKGAFLAPCLHADKNGGLYETPGLDWVIVGGESGPGARPFDVAWARSVVRQCREAGVACFVKQMGSNVRTRNDSLSTEHEPDVPTDWPEPEEGWGRIDEDLNGYRDGYQGAPIRIHLAHPKGGDPAEWPEDLRVREFPS